MYNVFKRLFDMLSASLVLIVISPILLVIAILVRINLGAPVLFKQERTGKNMKKFYIRKFRTMTNQKGEDGELLPDEQRVTSFGKFLRGSSLDELPELFNIVCGDMSVIGPRPLPPIYDEYYTAEEKKRFTVRGGLIPPEVLYGNVQPTWEQQFKYESDYAQSLSFSLDLSVFFAVLSGLFKRYNNNYGEYARETFYESRMNLKSKSSMEK